MASFCRSALLSTSRTLAARTRTISQKSLKPLSSPLTTPSTRTNVSTSRFLSALGSVESLMPLHSAVANARLKSNIAVDTSCWSWLSQVSGRDDA